MRATKTAVDSRGRRDATIVVYHAIGSCPEEADPYHHFLAPGAFAAHMEFLARVRTIVPLEAILEGSDRSPKPAVAITFDDGYRSVLREAAPVLRRFGFPATVFVPTDWIGRRAGWTGAPEHEPELMTAAELRELGRDGIEVESHGAGHLDMGAATREAISDDLARSRNEFERILGRPPRYLAYPYGTTSAAAEQAASEAGFEAAFTIDRADGGRFARCRVGVTRLDGKRMYALKTSGLYVRWRRAPVAGHAYELVRPLVQRARHARRMRAR